MSLNSLFPTGKPTTSYPPSKRSRMTCIADSRWTDYFAAMSDSASTEVAMRAAFKAVENGYQVGVLVPTTVLAEQHHKNFCERMGEFPLDIAKLSRFCTTREIRETIERLGEGKIDIVIGTHRLVSKDVKFFNLGLVIIDEEQLFRRRTQRTTQIVT